VEQLVEACSFHHMHGADEPIDWNAVINRKPPKYIYAYWKDDKHLEQNLSNCQFYVSNPLSFNDPFDCQLNVSFTGGVVDARTKTKSLLADFSRLKLATPKKRLKVFGRAVNSAHHGKLYKAEELENRIKTSFSKNGVVCFSEYPESILMWAHYASKHEGICIRLNTSVESWISQARQVQYVRRYPSLNYLNLDEGELFTRLILSKAEEWKYEKEWRYFFSDPPLNRIQSFPPKVLDAIVFGTRMKASRKAQLAKMMSRLHPHVELLESQTAKDQFKLEFRTYELGASR
jgi:hypothetical protein